MQSLRLISRARRTMPPVEAMIPKPTSVQPNLARSEATTMSQESAISMPPPAAEPLHAAITGLEQVRLVKPPKPCSVTVWHSPPSESSERSSPAQNTLPVPVTMMARTAGSVSALFMIFSIAFEVAPLSAFAMSGRLMRIISKPSSRSSDTTVSVPK